MADFEFLGPYRIGRALGRGGMGVVYAAVHEQSGEQVAVKLIAAHVADEPRFRRRFNNEVKTLQQLRHKHIVRIYGFGEEEGQLFYSMELVDGETLQARIRREKKISWLPAIDIAIQVCGALKHAHDFGVLHRDLKPANLLLTSDNHVKLVDFGIAKIFGDDEQTMAGSVLGTADYMAPEQATGEGVTVRTDLYAVGSVMYAMLAGRPPFRGKNVTEVIEALRRDRPVPLELIDPNVPEALVDLVHQLLEKDPDERPPTALAVMNRLKAMRAGLQKEQTLPGRVVDTSASLSSEASSSSAGDSGRSSRAAGDAVPSPRPTPVRGGGTAGSETATVVSGAESGNRDDDAALDTDFEASPPPRTHFQTVADPDASGSIFSPSSSTPESPWPGRIGAAAMLAALLGGGIWLIQAMRPPTADQLYESAIGKRDPTAMNVFLQRYPNDPRTEAVRVRYRDHQLRGQINRLRAQQRLGVTPLQPYEASFLAALSAPSQDPLAKRNRIDQWLLLYGDQVSAEKPGLDLLIELARHEQRQLEQRGTQVPLDPRAVALTEQVRGLADADDIDAAEAKLRAMIESFREFDWAQPAVAEAERTLEVLAEFGRQQSE